MSPQIVQVVLFSVVSCLAGGALAWRLLGRGHRGQGHKLAQDLTDHVHVRCSAYRDIENRINAVIAEFDRRESELHTELGGNGQPVEHAAGVASDSSDAEDVPATGTDVPESTNACGRSCGASCERTSRTPSADRLILDEGPLQDAATAIDRFAHRLEVAQREKSAELDRQSRWIESLEGRVHALEALTKTLAQSGRGVPEPHGAGAPSAAALLSRVVENEGAPSAVAPDAAAQAHYRELARRVLASTDAARARAEELVSEISDLRATVAKQKSRPEPRPVAPPGLAPAKDARPNAADRRPPRVERAEAATPQPRAEPEPRPAAAQPEVRRAPAVAPEPEAKLDDVQSLVQAGRGSARAGGSPDGALSQIGRLMKDLEIAKSEAETYRRRLDDQSSHFAAAYSMLDRMRPFVQALESEFAAQASDDVKKP